MKWNLDSDITLDIVHEVSVTNFIDSSLHRISVDIEACTSILADPCFAGFSKDRLVYTVNSHTVAGSLLLGN